MSINVDKFSDVDRVLEHPPDVRVGQRDGDQEGNVVHLLFFLQWLGIEIVGAPLNFFHLFEDELEEG